jgi:hypothetical protein
VPMICILQSQTAGYFETILVYITQIHAETWLRTLGCYEAASGSADQSAPQVPLDSMYSNPWLTISPV